MSLHCNFILGHFWMHVAWGGLILRCVSSYSSQSSRSYSTQRKEIIQSFSEVVLPSPNHDLQQIIIDFQHQVQTLKSENIALQALQVLSDEQRHDLETQLHTLGLRCAETEKSQQNSLRQFLELQLCHQACDQELQMLHRECIKSRSQLVQSQKRVSEVEAELLDLHIRYTEQNTVQLKPAPTATLFEPPMERPDSHPASTQLRSDSMQISTFQTQLGSQQEFDSLLEIQPPENATNFSIPSPTHINNNTTSVLIPPHQFESCSVLQPVNTLLKTLSLSPSQSASEKVLLEIVSTEEIYLGHLETCISLFMRPMMTALQADDDTGEKYQLTQVSVSVMYRFFSTSCSYIF